MTILTSKHQNTIKIIKISKEVTKLLKTTYSIDSLELKPKTSNQQNLKTQIILYKK